MSDDVDPARARRFAWRLPSSEPGGGLRDEDLEEKAEADDPGDAQELVEEDLEAELDEDDEDDEDGDAPSPELQRMREEAAEACGRLAVEIDRVWAIPGAPEQAAATGRLVRKVAGLGLPAVALNAHPLQSVRLARLAVRHFDRLSRSAREAAGHACLWLDYDHPEMVELVVEVASTGNQRIATPMWLALGDEESQLAKRWPELPRRLAALLDPGRPVPSVIMALDWLEVAPARDAVPAVRRVLRRQHFGARSRALRVLVKLKALTVEDLVFLAEDLVAHPPPVEGGGDWEEGMRYADAMIEAVASLRAPGVIAPLRRIVEGDCAFPDGYREWVDEGWALRALASGFPGEATPIIDAWLRRRETAQRLEAVEAAARLPLELARPRLLLGARDAAGAVSTRARDLWIEVIGSPCPEGAMAGFPLELLDRPPSAELAGRLQLLRGTSEEAREAMMEALLADAPSREALALLSFALGDDTLWRPRHRRKLPKDPRAWARRLVEAFGAPAVAALAALERRYEGGIYYDGWFAGLDALLRKRSLDKAVRAALGEHAAQAFLDGAGGLGPLELLQRIPARPELFEPLWTVFREGRNRPDGLEGPGSYAALLARGVLARWPRGGLLDRRIGELLQLDTATPSADGFPQLLELAFQRRHPAAVAFAQRVLDVPPAAYPEHVVTECARGLCLLGKLDRAAWVAANLRDPAGRHFASAARLAHGHLTAPVLASLRRAIASTAHDGRSAAQAAETLLIARRLPPLAASVLTLLPRVPEDARARLVCVAWHVRRSRPPVAELGGILRELLASTDPATVEHMVGFIDGVHKPRELAALRAALPGIRDPELRQRAEDALDDDSAAYWED